MKNKISNKLLILLLFTVSHISNAQTTETPLLEINGKTYSLEEFNYIYNKNNPISKEPLSKKEYLDLFVNYKLKVTEAEAQGMDTMPDFKKELEYYRNELAKPYLYDKKATEEVAREAYDRMLEEVDVSHILIMIPKNPFPEETLKA
jgi:peptidyl-prolyl cis-trans isomerase SurA